MSDWIEKKCQACNGFTAAINADDALEFLKALPNWQLSSPGTIRRSYTFKNFKQTMFFINAVAFIAESEGHHPDISFGYNYCTISLTTHELNGLSENDFICAAKINNLGVN